MQALSNVIAAALMILVVISLTLILWSFGLGLAGGSFTSFTEVSNQVIGERASGEVVNINVDADSIDLRSQSKSTFSNIDVVYVNGDRYTCSPSILLPGDRSSIVTVNYFDCFDSGGEGLKITGDQIILVYGSNNLYIQGYAPPASGEVDTIPGPEPES